MYLIRLGGLTEIGEPIAYDVENEGMAANYILVWASGYREAANPPLTKDDQEKKLVGAGEVP